MGPPQLRRTGDERGGGRRSSGSSLGGGGDTGRSRDSGDRTRARSRDRNPARGDRGDRSRSREGGERRDPSRGDRGERARPKKRDDLSRSRERGAFAREGRDDRSQFKRRGSEPRREPERRGPPPPRREEAQRCESTNLSCNQCVQAFNARYDTKSRYKTDTLGGYGKIFRLVHEEKERGGTWKFKQGVSADEVMCKVQSVSSVELKGTGTSTGTSTGINIPPRDALRGMFIEYWAIKHLKEKAPHIVDYVYDFELRVDSDQPAMDIKDGRDTTLSLVIIMKKARESLRDYMKTASKGERTADPHRFYAQAADQLKTMHKEANMAHGDVKDRNILIFVDEDGAPHANVIDFGLSVFLKPQDVFTPESIRRDSTVYRAEDNTPIGLSKVYEFLISATISPDWLLSDEQERKTMMEKSKALEDWLIKSSGPDWRDADILDRLIHAQLATLHNVSREMYSESFVVPRHLMKSDIMRDDVSLKTPGATMRAIPPLIRALRGIPPTTDTSNLPMNAPDIFMLYLDWWKWRTDDHSLARLQSDTQRSDPSSTSGVEFRRSVLQETPEA